MATRQMLARATEGTAAPTPGYLYKDLAQAATANPSACQEMATYLVNRLQSKHNPNVKFKCLKVLAKLCDQVPRNQFRRCLSQHPKAVGAIKESMNFRGPLDPVRGDEPNAKVRQAAQEALDAVYREAPSSEVAANATSYGGNISASYAPSPHQGGGMGGGGGGMPPGAGPRRMEGIGNPRYSDPRLDPRYNGTGQPTNVKDAIREAGEIVAGMIKDPLARNMDVPGPGGNVPRQGHSELPGYGSPQYGRPPPGSQELARQTNGQWTMASNRGPAAVQPASAYGTTARDQEYYKARDTSYQWTQQQQRSAASAASGGVGGSWATGAGGVQHSTPSITISSNGGPSGTGGTAASDGSYEKNLILELCPPGGMKAVPPPDKLANFTKAVPSLNSDLICPVLLDCLEDGQPWIIRAKALCVMETCIQSGARQDGSNPYTDFFYACHEEICPLAAHPRAAIKDPAKRVLALLGLEAPAGGMAPAAAPPVSAPAPNLLDFEDDTPAPPSEAPPAPPSTAPPPPPTANGSSSLFGGMQVKGAPTPTAQAPAPSNGGSLLDDFAVPQPAPAPANSNDIFRDVGVKDHGAAATSSMFAQMNLKGGSAGGEDKKTDSEDAGDLTSLAANGGASSAFGFINQSASKDSGNSEVPPAPASFDPLKNTTPTTAQKKMMQMSPEQMQAMAYQQMMMQQQMQQMQMAYAMQHGGKFPTGMPMPPIYQQQGMPPMMPNMGGGGGPPGGITLSMNSHPTRTAKKDDKKFDFVKDAMQTETKKQ